MALAIPVLLLAAAALGAVSLRWRPGVLVSAVLPAALLAAAAILALALPAAHGVLLAGIRVTAVLAAMCGGSGLVLLAFALAGATPDISSAAGTGEAAEESTLRGGLAIGILERAAITVCILADFSAGLAVIVAAKGLARYPELRNPSAAEQFIIGTFVSVLWAAACAGVAVAVTR